MNDLPPPLVDAETDLRDFRFMPLDVVRFAQSDLVTTAAPEEIVAAILLWGASWHQVPAGSLPDDDRVLSNLAGFGRAVASWREVRDGALRGFVKCSDGRFYHPVVAEKAREAWLGRLKQRWRTYCSAVRMHNSRHEGDQRDAPTFEDWLEHGRPTTVARGKTYPQQPGLPLPDGERHAQQPTLLRATPADVARRDSTKGQGEGEGEGQGYINTDDARGKAASPSPGETKGKFDLLETTRRIASIGAVSVVQPSKIAREMDIVKGWIEAGISVADTIIPTIEAKVADLPEKETVGGLAFYDASIHKAHNRKRRPASSRATAPERTVNATDDDDARVTAFRKALKGMIGDRTYETWCKPGTTAISINGSTTTIKASSQFLADQLSTNFGDKLAASAAAAGCPDEIRIEAP